MTKTILSVTPMAIIGGTRYGFSYDRLLVSRGNRVDRHGRRASGGNFLVTHERVLGDMGYWPVFSHLGLSSTPGPVCHSGMPHNPPTAPGYLVEPASHFGALSPHGAVGYARARPGRAQAQNAQTAIEVYREGMPRNPWTLLSRVRTLKDLGSLHLALQFGWVPLLNDLRATIVAQRNLARTLRQLRRNNGRRVRRRRTLLDTTVVTTKVENRLPYVLANFSSVPNYWTGWIDWQNPQAATTETRTTKRWFSGAFTSYVPDIGSERFNRRAEAAIFGYLPTPSLVWEVTPWSWLIDWFTNAGAVFENLSANALDNQTCDYAYVMETQTFSRHVEASVGYSFNGTSGFCLVSHSVITERKSRLQAGPLGFGVTLDGISPYQAGILAALAASRGRR